MLNERLGEGECMVQLETVPVADKLCVAISVKLPKTTLLSIIAPQGYLMCGLLAVDRLDELHPEREIIAARVTGVKTIPDLLAAKVDAVTKAARERGIAEGMTGQEALQKMF